MSYQTSNTLDRVFVICIWTFLPFIYVFICRLLDSWSRFLIIHRFCWESQIIFLPISIHQRHNKYTSNGLSFLCSLHTKCIHAVKGFPTFISILFGYLFLTFNKKSRKSFVITLFCTILWKKFSIYVKKNNDQIKLSTMRNFSISTKHFEVVL